MKVKTLILTTIFMGTFSSCLNDDFMERYPLDKQTVATVFITNESFKTYMWQFYVNRSFMVYDYNLYVNEICDGYSDNACGGR